MLTNEPKALAVYRHTRTRGEYLVLDFVELKVAGTWQRGVLYTPMKENKDQQYVRIVGDFMYAFEELEGCCYGC